MNSITTSAGLKNAILQLEEQQSKELVLLKEEFNRTREGLKPINIIKSSFKELVDTPDLKTDVINAAIGLTTGILAKKIMVGKTINPFKKLLGIVVEMVVGNTVAKNTDEIKAAGSAIFKTLFSKKEEKTTS